MNKISIYNNHTYNYHNKRKRVTQLLKEAGFSLLPNGEIVVVLGGDGTFLSAVKDRIKDNPIFVGLNTGNLGFFSEYDFADVKSLVKMLSEKKYEIVEYPLYEVEVHHKNGRIQSEYFVNDIVVERKGTSVIHLDTKINKTTSIRYSVDSLIVSTSMGSGAYAMAAGGAVFLQALPHFQITPVARLRTKVYRGVLNPVVISDSSTIEIASDYKVKRQLRVVCDGKEIASKTVKFVRIAKSENTFKVIRSLDFDCIKHSNEKLLC